MRRGEALGLTWSKIDFEHKTISLTHQLKKDDEGIWILSPLQVIALKCCFEYVNYFETKGSQLVSISSFPKKKDKDRIPLYTLSQLTF